MSKHTAVALDTLPGIGSDLAAAGSLREAVSSGLFGLTSAAALLLGLNGLANHDRVEVWFLGLAVVLLARALVPQGRAAWTRRLAIVAGSAGAIVWAHLLVTVAVGDVITALTLGGLCLACAGSAAATSTARRGLREDAIVGSPSGWIEEIPDDERHGAADHGGRSLTARAVDRSRWT
jgi:hypothetical protein